MVQAPLFTETEPNSIERDPLQWNASTSVPTTPTINNELLPDEEYIEKVSDAALMVVSGEIEITRNEHLAGIVSEKSEIELQTDQDAARVAFVRYVRDGTTREIIYGTPTVAEVDEGIQKRGMAGLLFLVSVNLMGDEVENAGGIRVLFRNSSDDEFDEDFKTAKELRDGFRRDLLDRLLGKNHAMDDYESNDSRSEPKNTADKDLYLNIPIAEVRRLQKLSTKLGIDRVVELLNES